MSQSDPFTDAAFTGRLQKLLPMLGSEQAGEADAARRKIAEHLAHHRLSFTDLGQRLQEGARGTGVATQSARELSLERQLAIARAAKDEAAFEAQAAINRVRVLEIELQQATFEIGRVLSHQALVRLAAAIACIVAVGCLVLVVLPRGPMMATAIPVHVATAPAASTEQQSDPTAHVGPGEHLGRAAVQDLAIRLSPNDQATIRAFLNYGERVVIERRVPMGPQTWLLIRSATGVGWVRSGDVLQ